MKQAMLNQEQGTNEVVQNLLASKKPESVETLLTSQLYVGNNTSEGLFLIANTHFPEKSEKEVQSTLDSLITRKLAYFHNCSDLDCNDTTQVYFLSPIGTLQVEKKIREIKNGIYLG